MHTNLILRILHLLRRNHNSMLVRVKPLPRLMSNSQPFRSPLGLGLVFRRRFLNWFNVKYALFFTTVHGGDLVGHDALEKFEGGVDVEVDGTFRVDGRFEE